jgi:hypothetical protein
MMRALERRTRFRAVRLTVVLAGGLAASSLAASGCGGDDDVLTCAEVDTTMCTPTFPPTWDNVYKFVIEQRCGAATGAACHGTGGMQGGLTMTTQDIAFEGLVNGAGGMPRVLPMDASCSILTERVETSDTTKRMPRGGAQLSAGDRCAIEQWIAKGATKQ